MHLQLLWSRYILRYFIWSPVFTPVVIYTKRMSSNTCAFSSCDWATCKTCLHPSLVFLAAVSTGTGYTWSNILGLEAVLQYRYFPTFLYGKIVLRLMSILYWKLFRALKDHVTTVLAKKGGRNCMKFCKCEESKCKNRLRSEN